MPKLEARGIEGSRVRLRAVTREDQRFLRQFVNDPAVMRFSNVYRPIDEWRQESWFAAMAAADDAVVFAIDRLSSAGAELIGTTSLVDIDWQARAAELRIRIGKPSAWGGGLGSEATELLLRYGFAELNLQRIWLRVFASNRRAVELYRKHGFQEEGRLRRAVYIRGEYDDMLVMGLLRDEWETSERGPSSSRSQS